MWLTHLWGIDRYSSPLSGEHNKLPNQQPTPTSFSVCQTTSETVQEAFSYLYSHREWGCWTASRLTVLSSPVLSSPVLSCPVLSSSAVFCHCHGMKSLKLIDSYFLCEGVCAERSQGPESLCRKVRARLEQGGCYQGDSIQVKNRKLLPGCEGVWLDS